MKIFVETERLLLREILSTDIDGMFALDSDPEVHKYLGSKPLLEREQISDSIHYIRKQYNENGIGRWAIIDKKTNAFIGWTGLKYVTDTINNHKNYYDLGYRLIKKYWGRGIATETARATLDYAFNTLNINEVYAIADCQNKSSNAILKKVGLKCVDTFYLDGIKHNWFKIDAAGYKNNEINV